MNDRAAGAARRLLPGHEARQWRLLFWVHVAIALAGLALVVLVPAPEIDRLAVVVIVVAVYLPLAALNQLILPGPPAPWTAAWWLVLVTTLGIIAFFQGAFPPVEVIALLGYVLDVVVAGHLYGLRPALAVAGLAELAAVAAHVLGAPGVTDPFILAMLGVMLAAAAFLVGGLAGERWRAYERLESARSDFMGMVSHELRTPIAGIHSFASLLDQHWDRLDEGERRDLVRKVSANVRFLDDLVGRLLDLSRLEEGRFRIWKAPVEMLSFARETAERLEPVLKGHPVSLVGEPAVADADRLAVDRMLENLLSNAAKYSPADSTIEVTVGTEGGSVVVSVRDHGEGVAAGEREAIFERFYRTPGTFAPGTGIGLAVVRQLAELHDGEVRVEDAGPGARFTIRLPAYTGEPEVAERSVDAGASLDPTSPREDSPRAEPAHAPAAAVVPRPAG